MQKVKNVGSDHQISDSLTVCVNSLVCRLHSDLTTKRFWIPLCLVSQRSKLNMNTNMAVKSRIVPRLHNRPLRAAHDFHLKYACAIQP